MRTVLLAIFFGVVCVVALLASAYIYFGAAGTSAGRRGSITRCELLSDPTLENKRQFLTKTDIESLPINIAKQYEGSVRVGYSLALQVGYDQVVMIVQSMFLLAAGIAGLAALKRPRADDY